jgi:hypothetical protein
MALHQRQLAGFALALTVFPSGVGAQAVAPAGGRDDWQRVDGLAPGTSIVVKLKTGENRVGDFRRATADHLAIVVRPKEGGARTTEETLPKSQIVHVATGADPLLNGALIGAGIGTGLAMWDYLIDPSEPGNAAIFTVAIGVGAAIGAGIDALVNKRGKVLYAPRRQTAGVTVSPVLGKDQQGVLVSIRF